MTKVGKKWKQFICVTTFFLMKFYTFFLGLFLRVHYVCPFVDVFHLTLNFVCMVHGHGVATSIESIGVETFYLFFSISVKLY